MNLQQQLGEWYPLLSHVFDTEWMQKLGRRLGAAQDVVPAPENWFRAFRLCPPSQVKVVICLQDPYIRGEADGLAMSSFGRMTPSLEVVFEEINRTEWCRRTQTHLDDWAVQGVLLINAVLTTQLGYSKAHTGWGWELFMKEVLFSISVLPQPIVFMAWGKDAQTLLQPSKRQSADSNRLCLKTVHPQAQNYNPSNKFVGCNHFVDANLFLMKHRLSPIWWSDPIAVEETDWQQCQQRCLKWEKYLQQLKGMSHAETNITSFLYSYPAVPDQPHPFDDGLRPDYTDELPF